MVRAFDFHRSSSFNFRKMFDIRGPHHSSSPNLMASPAHGGGGASPMHPGSRCVSPKAIDNWHPGSPFRSSSASNMPSPPHLTPTCSTKEVSASAESSTVTRPSDMELMKEKFAKLLLGEDMSGGGNGVSPALALSNSITDLAASVFGELRKLEPMNTESKSTWKKQRDWLLSVTDHIVELVPAQQQSPDGTIMEVMASRQRSDLLVNIPALRKLDTMLTDCLDNFRGQHEFWYVESSSEAADEAADKDIIGNRDWWNPTVKVPNKGLSEVTRKWLQHQKESVNQVLKAALSINAQTLSEMEIPESYIESLPKNGRASLGESIYKSITDEHFDPDQFLCGMDLTSEQKVLDLMNRIEASIVIWKRKMVQKDGKSSWGSAVSLEKREIFEDRAETILLLLKHLFPGICQSVLDMSKIQHNQDVGRAVLESYSRVLESLASAVTCRIDDVLEANAAAQNISLESSKRISASSVEKVNLDEAQPSMTLMDFMGWSVDQSDIDAKRSTSTTTSEDLDETSRKELLAKKEEVLMVVSKMPPVDSKKVTSYLERLENWGGMRSPTARH